MIGRAAELAGKPAYCIHVYKKTGVGHLGDKVLVAIQGQKKRAYIVGLKQKQAPMVPRYDSNNIVLVEDNGTPTGTRIRAPIPSCLRGQKGDFTKILACATKFVWMMALVKNGEPCSIDKNTDEVLDLLIFPWPVQQVNLILPLC